MRKTLIVFAFLWILLSACVGFYLALASQGYLDEMESIAGVGDLSKLWSSFRAWRGHTVAHAHALCMSFLVLLVALVMPEMAYSDNTKKILGILLILGVVIGGIFEWFGVFLLIGLGNFLVFICVLIGFIGLLKKKE